MDIVRTLKTFHLKASFATLKLKHKFFLLLFLASLITNVIPHEVSAAFLISDPTHSALVFDTSSENYQDYLTQLSENATDQYYLLQLEEHAQQMADLTLKLKGYLSEQGSPLADYAATLVEQRNWKQIVSLSNAESSLCRNYPVDKSNCWGVGGAALWNMGDNLGEGIVTMNHFLNQYPKGPVKYSEMTFEEMNGLYKQPPAQHWVNNAESTYNDLVQLEQGT